MLLLLKFKKLLKKIKNLDLLDLCLIMAGVLFLTIFLLKVIPSFMDWAHRSSIWIILLVMVLLFARPCYKYWIKQREV